MGLFFLISVLSFLVIESNPQILYCEVLFTCCLVNK